MHGKNHTVELAPARQADGDIMPPAAAALMQPQYRPHVVAATNDALPSYAWIVASVIILAVATIAAVWMYALGAPGWQSLISWLVFVIPSMYWTMQLLSGDWAAMKEVWQIHKTERSRHAAIERMHKEAEETKRAEIAANREIELARIEKLADSDTVHRMIMAVQAQVARLADAHDVPPVQVQPATYVPATPSEAVTAAKRWVHERMAESPDGVTAPQLAKMPMPWNAEWKAQPWAPDARQWLLDNVLEQHGTVYRWRQEFADVASAVDELRRL